MICTRNRFKVNEKSLSLKKLEEKSSQSTSTKDSSVKFSLRKNKQSVQCPKKKYQTHKSPPILLPRAEKKVFQLSQILEKQRQKDLAQIKTSIALLKYYNSLLMLFMMIYTSSQIIITNIFGTKIKKIPSFGLTFVDSLLKVYQHLKQSQLEDKLKRLAVNIMKIAPTATQFQKKAEFISRKVTLNKDKKLQIQTVTYNREVQSFWIILTKLIFIDTQCDFIQDLFESNVEKLCLKDFQYFIDHYLSTSLYENQSQHLLTSTKVEKDKNHDFTIQFLLIQKICIKDFYPKKESKKIEMNTNSGEQMKKACDIY